MDKTLYVYANDRLNNLVEDLNQRTFLGIGSILNIALNIENFDFSIVLTQNSELIRRFPYVFTCVNEEYSEKLDAEEAIETDKLSIANKHLEKLPLLLYKSGAGIPILKFLNLKQNNVYYQKDLEQGLFA